MEIVGSNPIGDAEDGTVRKLEKQQSSNLARPGRRPMREEEGPGRGSEHRGSTPTRVTSKYMRRLGIGAPKWL